MVVKLKKSQFLPPEYSLIGVVVPDLPGNKTIEVLCDEYNGQVIDFYTMNMEDLATIAKYRVLPVPTLLLVTATKTVARFVKDIPSATKIKQILNKLIKE